MGGTLFGGVSVSYSGYGPPLGDTWTFVGGQWTNITSKLVVSPSPRDSAAATYDSAIHEVVLFGGSGSYGKLNDTWLFAGSEWVNITASLTVSPPARSNAMMTYDEGDGYVLLFGGAGADTSSGLFGDTWAFEGEEWVDLTTANSPPPRYQGMMADDVSDGYVLLFGGEIASGYTGDTWAFRGGIWTNFSSEITYGPQGEEDGAMTYDPITGTVLLVNSGLDVGLEFGGTRAEMWTWSKSTSFMPVSFLESGLPAGTSWSVTLNGVLESSTTSTIGFTEPNGTYSYSITPIAGYSTAYSGQVTVNGAPVSESVKFAQVTYAVALTESGLPSGTTWSVTMNGVAQTSAGPTIAFSEPNGSYSFSIGSVSGYTATPSSGSVTVDGAAVTESITFTAVPPSTYAVTFTESGLPGGTSWTVTLNGATESSTTSTIAFTEGNGSYSFSIGAVSGYTANPGSGSITVAGSSHSVAVYFTESSSSSPSSGFLGLPGNTGYYVIGGVAAVVVAGIAIAVVMRSKKR